MKERCTVVIGAAELLPALRERLDSPGEILAFRDDETTGALETIRARRPEVIALERIFAATSRGAALITRLHADPALSRSEIRVMSHDSDYVRLPRRTGATQPARAGHGRSAGAGEPMSGAEYRVARRVDRFRIAGAVEVLLDGNPATLVDLSPLGAQVVSPTILRPNQRVRIALPDQTGLVRFNATVVWAAFELIDSRGSTQYRAGLEFHNANQPAVAAFIDRHQTS